MEADNKQDSLLKGTFILALAMFGTKFLGLIYRVVLSRTIGSFGFGIFDKVYPIYTVLLIVGITGLPVAISKLVAEKQAAGQIESARYIFQVARKISCGLGLIGMVLFILMARPLADYLLDAPEAYYSILAVAPAILVVFLMASYRGYFQGQRRMTPTAISQLVEQLIKVVATLGLVYLLSSYRTEIQTAGAMGGTFFGALGGLIVVLVIYHRSSADKSKLGASNRGSSPSLRQTAYRIFSLALPVTLGSLVLPLMRTVDASLITRRLEVAGYTYKQATSIYGEFGYALTLFRFPTVIATSLAMNLVPNISEADTRQADQVLASRISQAFKLVFYATIPAGLGLFVLARPLCRLIFANPGAAIPLRILAWGVIGVGIQQVTTSILQGFEYPSLPARNLFIGILLNGGLNYYLTALPELGIMGAALGTISGFALAAGLNIWAIFELVELRFDYRTLMVKPLFSGLVMAGLVAGSYQYLESLLKQELIIISSTVVLGIVSYTLLLLLVGGLTRDDIETIPQVGNKLASWLSNLGLVRG